VILDPADQTHFWALVDRLAATSKLVIDRPRRSRHPRISTVRYPLDYGHLAGTTGGDGDGIDVWRGTLPTHDVTGAIVTVDLGKRDAELKILVGCTPDEARAALEFHTGDRVAGLLIPRDGGRPTIARPADL
jgi:inorganic pyrophosphatase